ncbi:MAG TPA: extracellular solute-binding protein [Mycobacteriales bacterium]|jgi:putative aldouronate transport system substrate-binding protein|nr:extracellular solute-binding protein [Mycobacteriales bacterium]
MPRALNRRHFLQKAGSTAALAAASGPLLAGCHSSKNKNTAESNTKVKVPTYTPYGAVRADLAGNPAGLQDAYLRYPANAKKAVASPPGKGGDFTPMTLIYGAVPPGPGSNKYWQELNKRLGVNLKLNVVPDADYDNKFAAVVAGGDLPDTILIRNNPAHLPQLLSAKAQNLTEFLSGDAVKDYPFLANLPTDSWRSTIYDGGIYGLPIPRAAIGNALFVRTDIIKARGLDPDPKSFADFRTLCKGLIDKKKNRWAAANPWGILTFVQEMLKAPNGWKEDGGKFTSAIETDETRRAIDAITQIAKDGSFHPDAFAVGTTGTTKVKQWMYSGAVSVDQDGFKAWSTDVWATSKPLQANINAIVAPGYDGGPGSHYSGSGVFAITALKKASKERTKEVLSICNWLAAPFGTDEYLFLKYGIKGTDYTLKDTDPILNTLGASETSVPIKYIVDGPDILYSPGQEALARAEYAYQQKAIPVLIKNPTVGLFSDTNSSKGAELTKTLTDLQTQIFQGRKKLSDWDDAVKAWRTGGGDTIRKEYQESFAKAN